LFSELERILEDKIRLPKTLLEEALSFVKQTGLMSEVIKGPTLNIKDKDDIPIIYSALNGGADLFVTGDKELLNLRTVDKMMIVDPRSFWELLKSQQEH